MDNTIPKLDILQNNYSIMGISNFVTNEISCALMYQICKDPSVLNVNEDFWKCNEYFDCREPVQKFMFALSFLLHSHDINCKCKESLFNLKQHPILMEELIIMINLSLLLDQSDQFPYEIFSSFLANTLLIDDMVAQSFCLNFPFEAEDFKMSLLKMHLKGLNEMNEDLQNVTLFHIQSLMKSDSKLVEKVYDFAISHQNLFELALTALIEGNTMTSHFSLITELSRLLFHPQFSSNRVNLLSNFRNLQSTNSHLCNKLFMQLVSEAKSFLEIDAKINTYRLRTEFINNALELLRVCGGLRSYVNLEFSPELSEWLMRLIIADIDYELIAVHFIKYSVAFFIALRPTLMSEKTHTIDLINNSVLDSDVYNWFKRLIEKQDIFYDRTGSSYSELLLLLATLFHLNSSTAIAETITSILGLSFSSLVRVVSATRKLFTQHLFNELATATQAVNVPITPELNQNMKGYLPIHCMIPLLQSNAFIEHKIPCGYWILAQLKSCRVPLHDSTLLLIDSFIANIFASTSNQRSVNDTNGHLSYLSANEYLAIKEEDLLAVFSERDLETNNLKMFNYQDNDLTPHLLMLYYVLSLYDSQLKLRANGHKRHSINESSFLYSQQVFDKIPITYLLRHCRKNLNNYRTLYPLLLSSITNHFPNLVVGELMIQDELMLENFWHPPGKLVCSQLYNQDSIISQLKQILTASSCDFKLVNKLLRELEIICDTSELEILLPMTDVIGHNLLHLIFTDDPICKSRKFLNRITRIWRCLHLVLPRDLELVTVNSLRPFVLNFNNKSSGVLSWIQRLKSSVKCGQNFIYQDLFEDPLEHVLFAVDRRVFRTPQALDLVLRCLESALLASRSLWAHRVVDRIIPICSINQSNDSGKRQVGQITQNTSVPPVSDNDCEDLRMALLVSQDTAIVQSLLEFCLPTETESLNHCEISNLREIRQAIGSFIHYLFISEPSLANVVHWQTYPRDLLSMTVQTIPSLHITMDSAFENFRLSGNYNRMTFYINLISHLALFYNIKPTFDLATSMLDCFSRILVQVATGDVQRYFLLSSLPAFIRLVNAFPSLAPNIIKVLIPIAQFYHHNDNDYKSCGNIPIEKLDIWNNICNLQIEEQDEAIFKAIMNTLRIIFYSSIRLRDVLVAPLCN